MPPSQLGRLLPSAARLFCEMQLDAPVVTKAFLTHDMATLNEFCGSEIMQRLEGLCKAFQQQVRRCRQGQPF